MKIILLFFISLGLNAFAEDPDYAYIHSLVTKKNVSTIAGLLDQIKKDYPSYLDNYTLSYDSFSLHGSSHENPWAIVFGQNANLVLTYNGDPSQAAFANLELMTFDLKHGYEFREILFLQEPHAESQVASQDVEFTSPNVQISRANPALCLTCHGPAPIRPIWETYFAWPGTYGSYDDFTYVVRDYPDGKTLGTPGHAPWFKDDHFDHDLERDAFRDFQNRRAQNPRYANLAALPLPRIEPESRAFHQLSMKPNDLDPGYGNRPNLAFLMMLSLQREELLFRDLISKSPTTKELEALAISLCNPITDGHDTTDIPAQRVLARLAKNGVALDRQFARDEDELAKENLLRLVSHFGGYLDEKQMNYTLHEASTSGHKDFLVAQAFAEAGIDLRDYSQTLRRYDSFFLGLHFDFYELQGKVLEEIGRRKTAMVSCATYGFPKVGY